MGKVILLIFIIFIIFILFAIYSGIRNIIQGLGSSLDQASPPPNKVAVSELERLGDLYERGLLSIEEFHEMKKKGIKY